MSEKRQKWYEIRNAANGKPTTIVIEDEIGAWGISAKQFRSDFGRIGSDEAINVHIQSGGGSVFDGNEIANIIGEHKGEVTVSIGSICASIATVIMCAGDKIVARKNSLVMIHNPSVYAGGDSEDLRKTADIMDKMKEGIIAAYMAKTGKTKEELSDAMDEETWFTAQEAKDFGFVDEIVDEEADDSVVDGVDLSHYKNFLALLSHANIEGAPESAANPGNGKRLTLQVIKNAVKQPVTEPENLPKKENIMTKTQAEIDAENKAIEEKAQARAREIVAAGMKRSKEIRDMADAVKKRDKKDFAALVVKFTEGEFMDKSVDDFARMLITSDEFKDATVIGSGVETVYDQHGIRGTIGEQFVNSEGFREIRDGITKRKGGCHAPTNLQVEVNPLGGFRNAQTTAATSGSGLTSIEKLPGVIELGVRPLTIEDLISPGQTDNTTIRYIQEVTYTEAATTVGETDTLPELSVTYTEVDAPVKDVGGYIKMSENLLADYPAVASFINQRVPYQVDRAVDDQLLNGDGTGTNLTGILQTAGIQTLALGGGNKMDLPLKLQTLIRWQNMTAGQAQGGFEPDGYVVHPTDWETLVLMKDANGQYLCRGPFTGSYGNALAGPELVEYYTLWGKKVVISPVTAQGTIVCGAWRMGAQVFNRQGLIIEMTNSNEDDFKKRLITVRGTRRLALPVYRPGSFATGTGL